MLLTLRFFDETVYEQIKALIRITKGNAVAADCLKQDTLAEFEDIRLLY